MLWVRWYEHVREILQGWEVRKLVHDSCKDGDIVQSMVVDHRSLIGEMAKKKCQDHHCDADRSNQCYGGQEKRKSLPG